MSLFNQPRAMSLRISAKGQIGIIRTTENDVNHRQGSTINAANTCHAKKCRAHGGVCPAKLQLIELPRVRRQIALDPAPQLR
jgi:hypothetical protein